MQQSSQIEDYIYELLYMGGVSERDRLFFDTTPTPTPQPAHLPTSFFCSIIKNDAISFEGFEGLLNMALLSAIVPKYSYVPTHSTKEDD